MILKYNITILFCYNCLRYSIEKHTVQVCSLAAIGYSIKSKCAVGFTVLSVFV